MAIKMFPKLSGISYFIACYDEDYDLMTDKSIARLANIEFKVYCDKLLNCGGHIMLDGVYFYNSDNCQKAIDDIIMPLVIVRELIK